jgi:PKD repeat protein
MAIGKTALRGTAGLSIIIGMVISGAIYYDYTTHPGFKNLTEDEIYTPYSTYHLGEIVKFYLTPKIQNDEGIDQFVWDFHDGDYLYTSTRSDPVLTHVFNKAGTFTVSILALKGPVSRVFTVPVTILPSTLDLSIQASATNVLENEIFNLTAIQSFSYTPVLNFIWNFGDGETKIGKTVEHNFTNTGIYNVQVRGYSNNSFIYTGFQTIEVTNKIPLPSIITNSSIFDEDLEINFQASVDDTNNDLSSLKYIWSFGDNSMDQGKEVSHIYPDNGSYTVTLTTIDDNGASGTATSTINITNNVPVINQISNQRNFYSQGETITTTASISDSVSDMNNLIYNWSIPGDGQVNSYPFFEQGIYSLGLNVTDDNGASTSATTNNFQVINVNPYVSLLSAYTDYNVTFRTWGTLNTTVNITLTQNGNPNYNLSMVNHDLFMNISSETLSIPNLHQNMFEYWDILINSTNNQTYDTYVQTTFTFTNHSPISLINHCTNSTSNCLASSYRFPIAPLDRGFPISYNFSVFDPGNDNLSVTMDIGGTLFNASIPNPVSGPTSGTVLIKAELAYGVLPSAIKYYSTDEHGGQSKKYSIPFTNYDLVQAPNDYINMSSWSYFGYYIQKYATEGIWNIPDHVNVGDSKSFVLETQQIDNLTNYFYWHFGDGSQSSQRFPTHAYTQKGTYLVWVLVQNQYYEHVDYMWLTVDNPFPSHDIIVQGTPLEGNHLNFSVSSLNLTSNQYFIGWDFGDGSKGFGPQYSHSYTSPGNFTTVMTIRDIYNQIDTTEVQLSIFNTVPYLETNLSSNYQISEGSNLVLHPNVVDSPADLLNLSYDWSINGQHSNNTYVTIETDQPFNTGSVVILDQDGLNVTQYFTFTASVDPLKISLLPINYLYGTTQTDFSVVGSISPSNFFKDNYRTQSTIEYVLYDKTGNIAKNGSGQYNSNNNGFTLPINVSILETPQIVNDLKSRLLSATDLTPTVNPSGIYSLLVIVKNSTSQEILSQELTNLDITFDQDGDFLPDALEILYSNTLGISFDIYNKDTNSNDIADPVEQVIGVDNDGDGLPQFYEEKVGTFDNTTDSDGDGLTDGFGPNGELTQRTDPLRIDTDGDGLNDYQEVQGWQLKLITTKGVSVSTVLSDPLSNDTDQDGVSDYFENNLGSNPNIADTDSDGLTDFQEQQIGTNLNNKDSDFDDLPDLIESDTTFTTSYYDINGTLNQNTFLLDPLSPDSDKDGISDFDEAYVYKTSGTSIDTDQDGLSDYIETFKYSTNPLKADSDGDKLADGLEIKGFDIPVIHFSGGIYGEGGTVIQAPTVTNTTTQIVTNPLLVDTDGDGLTDGDELLGNSSTISNPALVDSDNDGISDLFDTQKLLPDYEPAQITSNINVFYSVRPSSQVASYYGYLTSSLQTIWNLMKNTGNLVGDIIGYSFYWIKSCSTWWFFGYHTSCSWSLHTRSWGEVANYAIGRMLAFIRDNQNTVFPSAPNWQIHYSNAINFRNFGMSISKDIWGVPNGLSFNGYAEMVVQNFYSYISGIVDPTINIQANIADNAGISAIYIYKNGSLIKGITGINSKSYFLNEAFSVLNNGFTVSPTTFYFKIHDLNGNVREFSRTTSAAAFSVNYLNQIGTTIKEAGVAIVNFASDSWNWALGGISTIGTAAVNAANTVGNFVVDTYNKIANWVKSQFDSFWENFVRNTVTSLTRQYLEEAKIGFDNIGSSYASIQNKVSNHFQNVFDGSLVQDATDALSTMQSTIAQYIPSLDVANVFKSAGDFASSLASAFDGTVIAQAIDSIGELATNILNKVIKEVISNIIGATFDKYTLMIANVFQDIYQQVSAIELGIGPSLGINSFDLTQLISQVKTYLSQLTSPLTTLNNFINSISSSTFLNLINLLFIDNPSVSISLSKIIKNMYSPLMAVGLALYNIVNIIPSTNLFQKAQTDSNSFKKLQLISSNKLISSKDLTIPQWVALGTFAFALGGNVVKEKSILENAGDREFDKDVEITGALTLFGHPIPVISPQFTSAIGLFINGGIPAALATVALELFPSSDEGTTLNLERLAYIGYARAMVSILYMVVLGTMNAIGKGSTPGIEDKDAINIELIFFSLNMILSVVDIVIYADLIFRFVQPGFDTVARAFDLTVKYFDVIRDSVIMATNNGLDFKGKTRSTFYGFSYTFVAIKFATINMMLFVAFVVNGF